eukprot:g29822.t1
MVLALSTNRIPKMESEHFQETKHNFHHSTELTQRKPLWDPVHSEERRRALERMEVCLIFLALFRLARAESCTDDQGFPGHCISDYQCRNYYNGKITYNKCDGPDNIVCCSYGACKQQDRFIKGICQHSSTCLPPKRQHEMLCNGPDDWICCEEPPSPRTACTSKQGHAGWCTLPQECDSVVLECDAVSLNEGWFGSCRHGRVCCLDSKREMTVRDAVRRDWDWNNTCSTNIAKGLSLQLVQEMSCMLEERRMCPLVDMSGCPRWIALDKDTTEVPYAQVVVMEGLLTTAKYLGDPIEIMSALRTLVQQYMLSEWSYVKDRRGKHRLCGIAVTGPPGGSHHNSGYAVDVVDPDRWARHLRKNDLIWLGGHDPWHFDYNEAKQMDVRRLSVEAFQRLWNRNQPHDTIPVDGQFTPEVEARLLKYPAKGFDIGRNPCRRKVIARPTCNSDGSVSGMPSCRYQLRTASLLSTPASLSRVLSHGPAFFCVALAVAVVWLLRRFSPRRASLLRRLKCKTVPRSQLEVALLDADHSATSHHLPPLSIQPQKI